MAPDPLLQHLVTMLGPEARFRAGQREATEAVLKVGARLLLVQRTGWGKSIVYWIATRARRDEGHGPTLIISPLLSLMRNQIAMAGRIGLRAFTINAANVDEWADVEEALAHDRCDVLMISPERFANEDFLTRVLPALPSIGLFVVDEAHCISDWGHDFRPDYRRIRRILAALPASVPVLATTATANDRVVEDVAAQLGGDVSVQRGPLGRKSLVLQTIVLDDQAERLAWLAEHVPTMPGSGIIYCLTVADTIRVASWLRMRGIDAREYYGDRATDVRERLEVSLLNNEMKALVATVALGMGFDKPDLGFVIHYQRPGSVIAYYQQVGRAGRALTQARAVLLSGREDDDIGDYFISTAFPPTAHMETILQELTETESRSITELLSRLNLRRGQVEKALKLLEIEGAVGRDRSRYFRTPNPWEPDTERIERVTAARRAELAQMQVYVDHDACLMEFLASALDDPGSAPCGHCANDAGPAFPVHPDTGLVNAATTFLKRDARPISPKLRWAADAVTGLRGRIEPGNVPGFALCVYGDAGWGRLVADGKYGTGHFDSQLVKASAELIARRWNPQPSSRWVTAVPSASRPGLLGAFGTQLAEALGIPFVEVLATASASEQKLMENSVQQLRNVHRKLKVVADVPSGPVLLVDDMVDSGWTLTYAGWLLRKHGSGDVFPFALAAASNRGDT
ncbi:MAG: RecQ family ATP-dependent DNA helicase [Candidatus Limnocylindria bacterium]